MKLGHNQILGTTMIKYFTNNVSESNSNYFKLHIFFFSFFLLLNGNIQSQSLSAEQIYEKVKDAVVVILAYDYADELSAQGSGVVLNDKGYVVTNYHVLSGNERLEIMHGEEIVPYVDIIGIDVEKDILIIKIEENKFPSVKIGDVKSLKVGQRVYAIGSPMGFENTISEGIISGLRSYKEQRKNYIQITASISSGSSGGAVVNDKGELIGISTLTVSDGQNLNFAIPIDEVLNVEIGSYSKNNAFKDFELFEKGISEFKDGDYESAVKYFSHFIKFYPNYEQAYYNRGLSKYYLGNYYEAIEDYNKAIEINPKDEDIYINRGNVNSDLYNYTEAIQDYNRSIAINPLNADAFYNRGNLKNSQEDYYGAITDYNKAIEINSYHFYAYHNRGLTKAKLDDYLAALDDFNKAIEINPKLSSAYYNRGITKMRLGDKYGACLDLSKAGELGYYDSYKIIKEYCN